MTASLWGEEWWCGGYYELSLELAPEPGLLAAALRALWSNAGLNGCYRARDMALSAQPRVAPEPNDGWLYGTAAIPGIGTIPCGTFITLDFEGSDWLDLCLPMHGLATADRRVGGFPFGPDDGRPWRDPLDRWLAGIGREVFRRVPFRLGLIGFDIGMEITARELSRDGVRPSAFCGILWPEGGALAWLPAAGAAGDQASS